MSAEPRYQPQTPQGGMGTQESSLHRTSSTGSNPLSPSQKQVLVSWQSTARRQSFAGDMGSNSGSFNQVQSRDLNSGSGIIPASPAQQYSSTNATPNGVVIRSYSDSNLNRANSNGYMQPVDMVTAAYTNGSYQTSVPSRSADAAFAAAVSHGLTTNDPYPYPLLNNMSTIDMGAGYGFPVFGGEEYSQNPFAVADDFTQWLFNDANSGSNSFSPPNYIPGFSGHEPQLVTPYFSQSPTTTANHTFSTPAMQHPMNITNILGATSNSNHIMSESKRQELIDLMLAQFIERPHDAVKKRKDLVFEGDLDADGHILSLRMMHTYIGSYWYHQHAQLPILHKPTFSADRTPNLLLLIVVAIGAATLDKAHGTSLTDSAAEFANFVAWHIRWEIVRDADFRPPPSFGYFRHYSSLKYTRRCTLQELCMNAPIYTTIQP